MLNCNDILELAPLYIAGELDPKRAAEFDVHLRACPACMRELETQGRLDARLREVLVADDVDVSRVNRRVRELIAAESAAGLVSQMRSTRRARRRWMTAALGIAAAVLLLAAVHLVLPGHVARVYADAAADHRLEVVQQHPRAWVTDPAKIAALAAARGITDSVPLTLAPGYHLERARVCWLDGRFFFHAVYSDGTREFSLYLRPRDGRFLPGAIRGIADGRFLHASSANSEHVSSFETSRLTAMVVTDQSADAALRLAKSVSASI
jgi:anti-sigma factor RsiW